MFGENAENLKPEEESFLKKIKEQLSTVQTITQLLALILNTAKNSGIDIQSIEKVLGLH